MTIQKAGMAALPFLLNPATVGVVALGAVGWGIYNLLRDEDEEEADGAVAASNGPRTIANGPEIAAPSTSQDVAQANSHSEPVSQVREVVEPSCRDNEEPDEAERREIVRQAMSELGKRSAAARAKRKEAATVVTGAGV